MKPQNEYLQRCIICNKLYNTKKIHVGVCSYKCKLELRKQRIHHEESIYSKDIVLNRLISRRQALMSSKHCQKEKLEELNNLIKQHREKNRRYNERLKKMDAEKLLKLMGFYEE